MTVGPSALPDPSPHPPAAGYLLTLPGDTTPCRRGEAAAGSHRAPHNRAMQPPQLQQLRARSKRGGDSSSLFTCISTDPTMRPRVLAIPSLVSMTLLPAPTFASPCLFPAYHRGLAVPAT
ncbi:hypothetical protein E2C01_048534 [Portunus trituberculatus]|uniref:Uncharacterized protein n=1 Tax=Portunus trituberculatus TaxID=210409 RepID=A0A5B7G433_PORTR|nr:hypothetical protein [Portunus trituberculatus]